MIRKSAEVPRSCSCRTSWSKESLAWGTGGYGGYGGAGRSRHRSAGGSREYSHGGGGHGRGRMEEFSLGRNVGDYNSDAKSF